MPLVQETGPARTGRVLAYILVYGSVYVLIGNNCDFIYIGQIEELKQSTRKHKSDVFHPNNTNCKKYSEDLRTCLEIKEPYFNIYPLLYRESNYP